MAEIEIISPIKIQISVTETEDRLPSFKTFVRIESTRFEKIFSYTSINVWYECNIWDQFISQINSLNEVANSCELKNMEEDFVITINKKLDGYSIQILCETKTDGANFMKLELVLDQDSFQRIKDSFNNFPRWWL